MDMIGGDPALTIGAAFNNRSSIDLDPDLRTGMATNNGNGDWRLSYRQLS
jgi:hypothetical protein